MLVIRFQRVGRRNDPAFRIVVTERRSKPQSSGLEVLGSFYPKTDATQLKGDRIRHWLSQGAKTSPRLHNLLVRHGLIRAKKIDVSKSRRAPPAGSTATGPAPERAMEPPAGAAPAGRVDAVLDAG